MNDPKDPGAGRAIKDMAAADRIARKIQLAEAEADIELFNRRQAAKKKQAAKIPATAKRPAMGKKPATGKRAELLPAERIERRAFDRNGQLYSDREDV